MAFDPPNDAVHFDLSLPYERREGESEIVGIVTAIDREAGALTISTPPLSDATSFHVSVEMIGGQFDASTLIVSPLWHPTTDRAARMAFEDRTGLEPECFLSECAEMFDETQRMNVGACVSDMAQAKMLAGWSLQPPRGGDAC